MMSNQMKMMLAAGLLTWVSLTLIFVDVTDAGACPLIPHCNSCTYDQEAKRATCQQCDPMFGVTWRNTFCRCANCSVNVNSGELTGCLKCKDFTKCDLCRFTHDGPDLNGEATCSACAPHCRWCKEAGGGKCDVCAPGARKVGSICEVCSVGNCAKCEDSASRCATCIQGFYLENNQCKPCVDHCRTCHNAEKCDYCRDYYFVETDSGQCKPCVDNCKVCSDYGACDACNTGFYKDSSNQCAPCDDSCFSCTDKNSCTFCKKGKVGENGSCRCADNCESCATVGNGKCDKCASGFVQSAGKGCRRACSASNCKTCDEKNACLECEPDFTLTSDGQCISLN